jgi:hypothetical protein
MNCKRNKNIIVLLTILFLAPCCKLDPKEIELKNCLNKVLDIELLEKTERVSGCMTICEIRERYPYISVIYLQNGCAPCYPKFIEWQKRFGAMELPVGYTVLFVIQGNSYTQFMQEVNAYAKANLGMDTIKNNFPVIMDPDFIFLSSNNQIPRWIIDSSVLIDQHNRIRMVGAPWASPEMTELFHRICNK